MLPEVPPCPALPQEYWKIPGEEVEVLQVTAGYEGVVPLLLDDEMNTFPKPTLFVPGECISYPSQLDQAAISPSDQYRGVWGARYIYRNGVEMV